MVVFQYTIGNKSVILIKKDKKEQESTEDDSPVPNRFEELPQEQSVVNNITPSPNETDELPF